MSHFVNLPQLLQNLVTDPGTAADPVKRMFVFDGEHLTVNVATSAAGGSSLHTQPAHDEIIIVLDGEAEFRVGDEIRRVSPGDMVFIPRNTLHGRVRTFTSNWSALSIYGPYFDRGKKNIVWDGEVDTGSSGLQDHK